MHFHTSTIDLKDFIDKLGFKIISLKDCPIIIINSILITTSSFANIIFTNSYISLPQSK